MKRRVHPRIRHGGPGHRPPTSNHDLNQERHERFEHANRGYDASTIALRIRRRTSVDDLIPEHQQSREELMQYHLDVFFAGRGVDIRNGLAGASAIGLFAPPVLD
jgi:hypothetical protein